MANTRINYDNCRTIKKLQQSTDIGRYILDVPGNGSNPSYVEDPYIRIQKWGGNYMTNMVNLESELLGVNKQLNNDCLGKNEYENYNVISNKIQYPSCNVLNTQQSRTTHPAWLYRTEMNNEHILPPNPRTTFSFNFENNLSTRIIEKNKCINNTNNNNINKF